MKVGFFSLLLLFFFSKSMADPDLVTLLAFKSSSDPSNALSSWSNSSNPCLDSWLGVTCNGNNNRITKLVLENLNLTGSIETLTHLNHLRLLSLKNNFLSSSSSMDFSSWKNMKLLYLSHNHFSGYFPTGISQLRRLRRVDFSHNRFSGHIPMAELNQLPHLLSLELQANLFTGTLISIDVSSSLLDFNVSDNNLSGEIPKPLSSFTASSFSGNKYLCGKPLLIECLNRTHQTDPIPIRVPEKGEKKKLKTRVIFVIIVIDALAFIASIAIFFYCLKRRSLKGEKNREKKIITYKTRHGGSINGSNEEEMVFFEGCKRFRVDDLLKASAEMLGKGSVGTTYKVVMEGGDVVVVKRARETKKKKEIEGLLREIGSLRHSNIVNLKAYYCSKDELLLVYDYFSNGSLHSLLHGNRGPGRTPLDWSTRLKLASGAAKGLTFLHSFCKSKLIHGRLTSSNIIIDQLGNACISDVALNQLFPVPPLSTSHNAYKAPELMINTNNPRKISHKSDVYSFGVILLEILTGKLATEEGETSLPKWVQSVVKEEWISEVFDIELLNYKEMEDEMVALLQVGLLCLTPLPGDRPKMSVVQKMIEDIMTRGSREEERGNQSPSVNDFSSDSSRSLSEDTSA